MSKVSIIVPVYKVEMYLARCVDSLINQTLSDIEIILVDDESPDSCPQLCDEYSAKDSRIKVIHKKNGGLGYARNSGLEIAEGEYVAFCDSDDYVDLVMYEKLYEIAKAGDYDAVYSEFNNDDYPGFTVTLQPEKEYCNEIQRKEFILDMIGAEPEFHSDTKYNISSCKAVYSLNVIRQNELRFKSEREYISEDMLFNMEFVKSAHRIKITPYQFYHYCLNNASLSHSYREDRWERELLMYGYLSSWGDYFNNSEDYQLRLNRTLIFFSRSCVIQLTQARMFLKKKKELLMEICNNNLLQSILNEYPLSRMPLRFRLFALLEKSKHSYLLLMFTYIFYKIKRG